MANGQQQDVFSQALQVATPGFDELLNVIQQETDRIERNKQLVQQREMKEDMLDLQAEKEIQVYEQTTARQRELDRQQQRDLAAAESIVESQEQAEQQDKDWREFKRDRKKELRKQYENVYGELRDKTGMSVPDVEPVVQGTIENPQEGYKVGFGEDASLLTPEQLDERYGWMREASQIVERFRELNQDDQLSINSTTEKVGVEEIQTSSGVGLDMGAISNRLEGEQATQQINKTFLGTDDAYEKIRKLKNGDREVYRKFKEGEYDFHDIPKGESQLRRGIQSDMQNILDSLNKEEDEWYIPDFIMFTSDQEAIGDKFSVGEIGRQLGQVDDQDVVDAWNRIRQRYGQLKRGRKQPPSDLFVNPKLLEGRGTEVPVEDYFITEDEIENESPTFQEGGDDFEVTRQNLQQRRSLQFLNSAVRDTAKLPDKKFQ